MADKILELFNTIALIETRCMRVPPLSLVHFFFLFPSRTPEVIQGIYVIRSLYRCATIDKHLFRDTKHL